MSKADNEKNNSQKSNKDNSSQSSKQSSEKEVSNKILFKNDIGSIDNINENKINELIKSGKIVDAITIYYDKYCNKIYCSKYLVNELGIDNIVPTVIMNVWGINEQKIIETEIKYNPVVILINVIKNIVYTIVIDYTEYIS